MISLVNSVDQIVRKIHILAIGLYIPILYLKITVTGIPKYFERYWQQWAMYDDGCKVSIGQLLLGTDCTNYFSSNLTNNGKQVKQKIVHYWIQNLQKKIIRYGAGDYYSFSFG